MAKALVLVPLSAAALAALSAAPSVLRSWPEVLLLLEVLLLSAALQSWPEVLLLWVQQSWLARQSPAELVVPRPLPPPQERVLQSWLNWQSRSPCTAREDSAQHWLRARTVVAAPP